MDDLLRDPELDRLVEEINREALLR